MWAAVLEQFGREGIAGRSPWCWLGALMLACIAVNILVHHIVQPVRVNVIGLNIVHDLRRDLVRALPRSSSHLTAVP